MSLLSFSGSIGAVATSATNLTGFAVAVTSGFSSRMRQAMLAGVPFAVLEGRVAAGRKNAIHDYPYQDGVWVEDTGLQSRRFDVIGMLIDNSRVYRGGAIENQRRNMLAAIEQNRLVEFVHPTLGSYNVNVLSFDMTDRLDLGGCSEIRLTLVASLAGPTFPEEVVGTTTTDNALGLDLAAINDYALRVDAAVRQGATAVQAAVAQAIGYARIVETGVADVRNFWGAVSNLSGEFGRFFGGGNRGLIPNPPSLLSVSELLTKAVVLRAAVSSAAKALTVTDPTDATALGGAAQALVAAAVASTADPSDAMRVCSLAGQFTASVDPGTSALARAIGGAQVASSALFRRAAIAGACRASAAYQPSSLDDAVAIRGRVVDLLDGEIEIAGDTGDDESFLALRALRQAVVADLDGRSAGLPALRDWSFRAPLPAPVLAQRMYRDASRTDELIKQIVPVHPLFCPKYFRALAV